MSHFPGQFAVFPLLEGPTPIQELTHLNAQLPGVRLFVKRDDLTPVGGGGNKIRKLEFLVGEARSKGADTLITRGGLQSNHARLTAAVAARAGMACELVLARNVRRADSDYLNSGNVLLDGIFGAQIHTVDTEADVDPFTAERCDVIMKEGRNPYVISGGGSSPVGCLGYAACALEIKEQCERLGLTFREIVTALGSAGTHAGLAAGSVLTWRDPRLVRSYSVSPSQDTAVGRTQEIANSTLSLLGSTHRLSRNDIAVDDLHIGEGYGIPTQEMIDAVRLLARTEGLLLDPVYNGKAFGGLLHDIRAGRYRKDDCVLFLMTGGTPALFAYRSMFE